MVGDALRRVITTGLGLALFTKEKAEGIVNEFVREGAVSRAEADRLLDELLERAQGQTAEIRNMISEQMRKALETAGLVRRDEYLALLERVERLESRLPLSETSSDPSSQDAPPPVAEGTENS